MFLLSSRNEGQSEECLSRDKNRITRLHTRTESRHLTPALRQTLTFVR